MNTSRVLLSVLVCFVWCSCIFSKPAEPTSDQKPEKGIVPTAPGKYGSVFMRMNELALITAALSEVQPADPEVEDCVRTARATIHLLMKPSTLPKAAAMYSWASDKSLDDRNSGESLVEANCRYLNEAAKMSQFAVPDFEQLKRSVQLPGSSFATVTLPPPGTDFHTRFVKQFATDDPDYIKLTMTRSIFANPAKAANAVIAMAANDTLKSAVDSLYVRVREDYFDELLRAPILTPYQSNNRFTDFPKKVHQYFIQNAQLHDEYLRQIELADGPEPAYLKIYPF